ncbi:hypothetical protein FKW77_001812 [Venturia effusa]|uniref:KOW domain-containing protein n=1 Tax=Venturia effusa TaxID=50376 RepID=A0A517LKW3_9PEZI|nr:hypothetical protein FKW77_001812 [Venturia effusa]
MRSPQAAKFTAQKTTRLVEASYKPVADRYQQRVDRDAARIADASLKASEDYIDRANYSINYRRKRALQEKAKADYTERKRARQRHVLYLRDLRKVYKDAKLARLEDIQLGPLAPKRDVGELKDSFGTVPSNLLHPPPISAMDRAKEEAAVGQYRFCVHDRVVVIRGKETGKIGTVTDVNNETMQLSIRGFNGVEYLQPEWMGKAQNDPRKYLPTNLKEPFRNCRLVVAAMVNAKGEFREQPKAVNGEDGDFQEEIEELEAEVEKEEQTWTTKEFILDHVDLRQRLVPSRLHDSVRLLPTFLSDPTYELDAALRENELLQGAVDSILRDPETYAKGKLIHGYKWEEIRFIPGTGIEIVNLTKDDAELDPSWEEGFDPDAEVYPGDTLQFDVEEETYTPMLTKVDFPASVLSELQIFNSRNAPISRIQPSILSNRENKAAQIEAQRILREEKMKTPLQEVKERRLEIEKQVLEKRRPSDDELFAKLGAAMLKTQFSSGARMRTEDYLAKLQEDKESRAAKRAAKTQALEEAAWKRQMDAESKKRLEPSEMRGNLRYEKVVHLWPTDPKAREAQRASRRAEREAVLVADAKIRQLESVKFSLTKEQDTLAAKVQAIRADIAEAKSKRRKNIPKLQDKLNSAMRGVASTTSKIAQQESALETQTEVANKMKMDILAQATDAMRMREMEQKANSTWY